MSKRVIRNPNTVSVGTAAYQKNAKAASGYAAASIEEDAKDQTLRALGRDCIEMNSDEKRLYDLQSLIEIGFPVSSEETAKNIRNSVLDFMIADEKNFLRRRENLMKFLNMQELSRALDNAAKDEELSLSFAENDDKNSADNDRFLADQASEHTLEVPDSDDKMANRFVLPGSTAFAFSVLRNGYYFRLPELTNYYNEARNFRSAMAGRFIQKMMVELMRTYESEHGALEKFDEFFAVFVLHYTEGTKKDTDNFDIKKPIDAINGILIENDDVSRSHILVTSAADENAFTELYVFRGHDKEQRLFCLDKEGGSSRF